MLRVRASTFLGQAVPPSQVQRALALIATLTLFIGTRTAWTQALTASPMVMLALSGAYLAILTTAALALMVRTERALVVVEAFILATACVMLVGAVAMHHKPSDEGTLVAQAARTLMGGGISVISVPGAGATFTVDLPFTVPAQVASLGASWPRPADGEKVLLVLEGDVEASLVCDQLVAVGASVARVRLKEAERIAADAEATGVPFTALLTDRAGVAAGAGRLIGLLRKARGIGRRQRTAVIIDPSERGDILSFRAAGFNYYLVRPVRPFSLLNQLFGDLDETQAKATDTAKPAKPRARASRASASGLSILLAQDNDINALLACTLLEKSGARVVRVRNGAEAIAKAGTALGEANGQGFDLIFMDIHMPDMDGIEAARRIRALYPDAARPAEGRPPIVALTANAFADDRAAYLEAGLDDYLAKPFEKADLAALLARWKRPAVAKTPSGRGAA